MIIKDEIHGTIEFDELETRIIDCGDFQRLRRIKQMSITNLVYPGATHTRFEHSLGTAHLASIICERLHLSVDISRKVKLYALLHDVGHFPFSHEGEDVLKKYVGDHEQIGERKIRNGEIGDILNENYNPKEIVRIGKSEYGAIVSSDLGADRMDYLKRDALNTGVAYGIIDVDRLMHTLLMNEGELCIDQRGLEAAEYLLIARFMMFSTVYHHKTVRIATALLYRAIEGSIEDGSISPKIFANLDDETAFALMSKSKLGGKYANALIQRKLYKEVCSFSRKRVFNEKKAKLLENDFKTRFDCDIIIDYPHPSFKPVSLKVKTEDGIYPITELSWLVEALKKSEEDRLKIMVLAEAGLRVKFRKKIEDMVATLD